MNLTGFGTQMVSALTRAPASANADERRSPESRQKKMRKRWRSPVTRGC